MTKLKTSSILRYIEEDLNFLKIEDELNISKNGRSQPKYSIRWKRPHQPKSDEPKVRKPKQFPNSGKASYYKIYASKQKKDGGRKMSKKSKSEPGNKKYKEGSKGEESIFKNHSGM